MPLLPKIAVTMGDPAGVGPELCLQLLQCPAVASVCVPLIFGQHEILKQVEARLGLRCPERVVSLDELPRRKGSLTQPVIVECSGMEPSALQIGRIDAACGLAAYNYIDAAIRAALACDVAGVATGPIHKEAFHRAGIPYPGHTEMFADKTGTAEVCMMLTSEAITVGFVTTHVGHAEAAAMLSIERVQRTIRLVEQAMRRIRPHEPRLLVCALNPHAGEHGLFGHGEEEKIIRPAVEWARGMGIQIAGPVPPDTAFLAARRAETDAYICMYHDQGHIPLKMLAFDKAVNVTLGLPIVRTSVDHGTAMDIAWQGRADVGSLEQAVLLAVRLGLV